MSLIGVDFTSAPSARKPIMIAHGQLQDGLLALEGFELLTTMDAFRAWLARPGPWLGGFDLPLGLPRAGVEACGWPTESWALMVEHVGQLERKAFSAMLDSDRLSRPAGARYPHRATDHAARSHSPFKLVNPPVGLMFHAGAPCLLGAELSLPAHRHEGDPERVALEVYPGRLARQITRRSYKQNRSNTPCPARRTERARIVNAMEQGHFGPTLRLSSNLRHVMLEDAQGDALDAVLALLQTAQVSVLPDYGLPAVLDPLEGWIAGAPTGAALEPDAS